MNVTAAKLDRLGVDHGVYRRVRQACRYAAHGIDIDEHALNVALAVCGFLNANNSDGPGRITRQASAAGASKETR